MKKLVKTLLLLAMLLLLVGLGFGAGLVIGPSLKSAAEPTPDAPALASSSRTEQDVALLMEAWRIIASQYYGKTVDQRSLLRGALHGMIDALGDPYSAYLSTDDVAQIAPQSDAELQSVGMAIEKQNDALLVVAPLATSPAQLAGVHPGDRIVSIDGRASASLTLGEAISLLRIPEGKPVTLTILRNSTEPVTLSFERGTVSTPLVRAMVLSDSIAYVNITAIGNPAGRDVVTFLQTLDLQRMRGLILDLRNNPGGYLDTAVEIAGQFVSNGIIVSQQGRTGKTVWSYADGGKQLVIDAPDGKNSAPVRTPPLAPTLPMVVLVNRGTASAAEVLAAALQDNGRSILIGERTFGKGAVTGDFALSDGSIVHIADGQWLTPKGRSVNGQGLIPDISVDDSGSSDAILNRAVQYLTSAH